MKLEDEEADSSITKLAKQLVYILNKKENLGLTDDEFESLGICYTLIYIRAKRLFDTNASEKLNIDEIGFAELPLYLVSASDSADFIPVLKESETKGVFQTFIRGGIRNVSIDNITVDMLRSDISLVTGFLTGENSAGLDDDGLKCLKSWLNTRNVLDTALKYVYNVFKEVLTETFGMHKYVGILGHAYKHPHVTYQNGSAPAVDWVRLENKGVAFNTLQPVTIQAPKYGKTDTSYMESAAADEWARAIAECLKNNGVQIDTKARQFGAKHYDAIIKGGKFYLPNKSAEMVFLRKIFSKTEKLGVYGRETGAVSIDTYWSKVSSAVADDIALACAYYLASKYHDAIVTSIRGDAKVAGLQGVALFKHLLKTVSYNVAKLDAVFNPNNNFSLSELEDFALEFLESYCTFVILQEFEYAGDSIVQAQVRICVPNKVVFTQRNVFPGDSTQAYVQNMKPVPTEVNNEFVRFGMHVYQYKYTPKPNLVGISPLWGYKVQQMNLIRGVASSADNILLGEAMDGREIYASSTNTVSLQKNVIHNIFASSRSGKGVMTMNIIIPQLASGKALFYLDDKPDMASALWSLSGHTLFAVNGGQVGNDSGGAWAFNGDANSADANIVNTLNYLGSNPDIYEVFGASDATVRDFVYIRSLEFLLGLTFARAKGVISTKDLHGADGLVVVMDEVSRLDASLNRAFSNIATHLGLEMLSASKQNIEKTDYTESEEDELKSKEHLVMARENALEQANAKNDPVKIEKATSDLYKAREQLALAKEKVNGGKISKRGAYAWALVNSFVQFGNCFQENIKTAGGDLVKSFINFYVIGQDINENAVYEPNKNTYFTLNNKGGIYGGNDKEGKISTVGPVRSLLEKMQCSLIHEDWFLGRPEHGWQETLVEHNSLEKWCSEDEKGWAYYGSHTFSEIVKGTLPAKQTFKAYLVLNNACEPPAFLGAEDAPDYANGVGFVGGVMHNVSQKVAGLGEENQLEAKRQVIKDMLDTDSYVYDVESLDWGSDPHKDDPNLRKEVPKEGMPAQPQRIHPGVGFEGMFEITRQTIVKAGKANKKAISVRGTDGSVVEKRLTDCDVSEILGLSSIIADDFCQILGWASWQDFIYDFSPEAIFTPNDICEALRAYKEGKAPKGSFRRNRENSYKVIFMKAGFYDEDSNDFGSTEGTAQPIDFNSGVFDSEPTEAEGYYGSTEADGYYGSSKPSEADEPTGAEGYSQPNEAKGHYESNSMDEPDLNDIFSNTTEQKVFTIEDLKQLQLDLLDEIASVGKIPDPLALKDVVEFSYGLLGKPMDEVENALAQYAE